MGLRAAAFLTAGSASVPFWKFVVADAGAAVLGVPLAFGLAYFFTDQIKAIMADVHRAERWLGLAGLLALAAMLVVGVWRWHRRVGKERLDRNRPRDIRRRPERSERRRIAGSKDERIVDPFYAVVRVIARFWIWFFFERVEVRHPERVPSMGPVLLCINHPNNLIDSLLVGSVLPRKVHYLATAALFRNPLIARFLVALGAIPSTGRRTTRTRWTATWRCSRRATRHSAAGGSSPSIPKAPPARRRTCSGSRRARRGSRSVMKRTLRGASRSCR